MKIKSMHLDFPIIFVSCSPFSRKGRKKLFTKIEVNWREREREMGRRPGVLGGPLDVCEGPRRQRNKQK